ncbi:MAG TPA: hypothetical protein GXX55_09580 [Firmicutes bacterium]|nr:hypothetical protein [Bacillota bacterium]
MRGIDFQVHPGEPARPDRTSGGRPGSRAGSGMAGGPGKKTGESPAKTSISGVAVDSRQVRPGYLFCAIAGTRLDGNLFIPDALAAGAAAVLTDRPQAVPMTNSVRDAIRQGRVLVVPDARVAVAKAAANFYGHPAANLLVAGVTGTLGKTSVSQILYAILQVAGSPWSPGLIGSLGIRYGEIRLPSHLTTPDAVSLQRTYSQMTRAGVRVAVMEVSSHGQLQHRVDEIPFRLGVFLNLIPGEHADVHPDFASYVAVKSRLLDQLVAGSVLVYNHDDAEVRTLVEARASQTPAQERSWTPLGYSCTGPGFTGPINEGDASLPGLAGLSVLLTLSDLALSLDGSRFVLRSHPALGIPLVGGGRRPPVELGCEVRLLGPHNARNAAAAAAAALALGVPEESIQEALAGLLPFRRRMERIYRGSFSVLDDTTGHPESFRALFETVLLLAPRRVWLLTATRGNRGIAINRANARTIAAWTGRLPLGGIIVTPAWDRADVANQASDAEVAAFRGELDSAGVHYRFFPELLPAVHAALSRLKEGDLLVIAGTQCLDGAAEIVREALAVPAQAT